MAILGKILKSNEDKKPKTTGGKKPTVLADKKDHGASKNHQKNYGILLAHRVTEKSSNLAAENKFVFLVAKTANKFQVKESIQNKFGVSVENVHIINLPAKERRRGNQIGWKAGVKKAIIKIKEGQTIEVK